MCCLACTVIASLCRCPPLLQVPPGQAGVAFNGQEGIELSVCQVPSSGLGAEDVEVLEKRQLASTKLPQCAMNVLVRKVPSILGTQIRRI